MIWLVAAFCALALGCAFVSWRAPKWPQGDTHIRHYKQFTVRVVFSDDLKIDKPVKDFLVKRTVRAVYAASYGWALSRVTVSGWKFHRKHKTIVVQFRNQEHFVEKSKGRKNPELICAYLIKVHHGLQYIPLLVISEDNINEVINTGEPVIHEMMHFLSNTYVQTDTVHDDPTVWAVSETWWKASAQSTGRAHFKRMIEE